MGYLDATIGRYYHDPLYIDRKTYGIDRGLTILISTAYDAGIIGPEHNGIVILDDDTGDVVIDQHFIDPKGGSNGPSRRQIEEYERIRNLPWKELGAFVKSHPRYRQGNATDLVGGGNPARGDLVAQRRVGRDVKMPKGKDIRTKEMKELNKDKNSSYAYPLKSRNEILAFLGAHPMHAANRYDCCLAWNIKVHSPDLSGHHENGEKVEARFDALWDKVADQDETILNGICEDAMRSYYEGEFTTPPGDDQGDYGFNSAGRSGGWLILSEFDGKKTVFGSANELREWMKEINDGELAKLYKLVATVDHDVANRDDALNYAANFVRSTREQEWRDDPSTAIEAALEAKLEAAEIGKLTKALEVDVNALFEVMSNNNADEDDILEAAAELGPEAKAKAEELLSSNNHTM